MAHETQQASGTDESPLNHTWPVLLFIVANIGTGFAADRPVIFWISAAVGLLGILATVGCLKKMWNIRQEQPSAYFWGLVLVAYSAYLIYSLADHVV
ncbi:hypothetical protein ACWCXK_23140 [Streptomyces sp. NPDC001739]|uniref:hypothetical protein n=1 Tax=Streptomyces sp. NPDC001633 TaxID=3364595 RepID=UPI00367459FB